MPKKRSMPRGIRKFIRKEKARIRREVSGTEERERMLKELYKKFRRETNSE